MDDLARESGISPPTLRKIERGEGNPPLTAALRLARVLDVEVEDIFGTTRLLR